MNAEDPIRARLELFVEERFGQLAGLSLDELVSQREPFGRLTDSFVQFLTGHRDDICRLLDECLADREHPSSKASLSLLADQMIRLLQRQNQFLDIDAEARSRLVALYEKLLSDLADVLRPSSSRETLREPLDRALFRHQSRLGQFLRTLAPTDLDIRSVFAQPVSGEYSPRFQLDVLHVQSEQMLEPILDLGCGETGALVEYLRQRGKEAFGVDRTVAPQPYLIRADWFEYPLGNERWGTIVSHMSLSNHFLHHHLRPHGRVEEYARRYLEILRSLKPSGCFRYAPGLPFFEKLLPRAHYRLETYPLSDTPGLFPDDEVRAKYPTSVFYACAVTRRPKT